LRGDSAQQREASRFFSTQSRSQGGLKVTDTPETQAPDTGCQNNGKHDHAAHGSTNCCQQRGPQRIELPRYVWVLGQRIDIIVDALAELHDHGRYGVFHFRRGLIELSAKLDEDVRR
jgi:hypothetical protein